MVASVVIIDTSVLCCWLRVAGRETAGSGETRYDYESASKELADIIEGGATLVLPIASVIETGNHIANAASHRFEAAQRLAAELRKALDAEAPWTAFVEQNSLWSAEKLQELVERWPQEAAKGIGIGDFTIAGVAEYYARSGMAVKILTGDGALKSYEPVTPVIVPRRRR